MKIYSSILVISSEQHRNGPHTLMLNILRKFLYTVWKWHQQRNVKRCPTKIWWPWVCCFVESHRALKFSEFAEEEKMTAGSCLQDLWT